MFAVKRFSREFRLMVFLKSSILLTRLGHLSDFKDEAYSNP